MTHSLPPQPPPTHPSPTSSSPSHDIWDTTQTSIRFDLFNNISPPKPAPPSHSKRRPPNPKKSPRKMSQPATSPYKVLMEKLIANSIPEMTAPVGRGRKEHEWEGDGEVYHDDVTPTTTSPLKYCKVRRDVAATLLETQGGVEELSAGGLTGSRVDAGAVAFLENFPVSR